MTDTPLAVQAMKEAALSICELEKVKAVQKHDTVARRYPASDPDVQQQIRDQWATIAAEADTIAALIRALPGPSDADLLRAALARPEVRAMRDAAVQLNTACDAMWNDHNRVQNFRIKEAHVKAISEAQQGLFRSLTAAEGGTK